jgi:hypothetical protein
MDTTPRFSPSSVMRRTFEAVISRFVSGPFGFLAGAAASGRLAMRNSPKSVFDGRNMAFYSEIFKG